MIKVSQLRPGDLIITIHDELRFVISCLQIETARGQEIHCHFFNHSTQAVQISKDYFNNDLEATIIRNGSTMQWWS